MSKVIIIGRGKTSELVYEYLKDDYDVVGFAESNPIFSTDPLTKLPVYRIEDLNDKSMLLFVAIGVNKLNTIRQKIYEELRDSGWHFLTYIHPRATVAKTATIGSNCIIMEENVIQDFVDIGDNNIIWSGNHIGHGTAIGDHNFISSHVVICGNSVIGNNNFFGVNSIVGDDITVGNFNWFSPLTGTIKNLGDYNLLRMPKTEISKTSTKDYFKL